MKMQEIINQLKEKLSRSSVPENFDIQHEMLKMIEQHARETLRRKTRDHDADPFDAFGRASEKDPYVYRTDQMKKYRELMEKHSVIDPDEVRIKQEELKDMLKRYPWTEKEAFDQGGTLDSILRKSQPQIDREVRNWDFSLSKEFVELNTLIDEAVQGMRFEGRILQGATDYTMHLRISFNGKIVHKNKIDLVQGSLEGNTTQYLTNICDSQVRNLMDSVKVLGLYKLAGQEGIDLNESSL